MYSCIKSNKDLFEFYLNCIYCNNKIIHVYSLSLCIIYERIKRLHLDNGITFNGFRTNKDKKIRFYKQIPHHVVFILLITKYIIRSLLQWTQNISFICISACKNHLRFFLLQANFITLSHLFFSHYLCSISVYIKNNYQFSSDLYQETYIIGYF